ncbi:MAG: flagellar motor switch protein FliN [Syntrophales bacterium]
MDQNELDRLMNEMSASPEGGDNAAKSGEDDNLSWDDVQQEMAESKKETPKTEVDEVRFEELADNRQHKGPNDKGVLDMEFILDIPLTLTVELGRNRLLINELLQLGQGSVIELTKLAGEPMDIYVNQRLIARGEVVVVNEKFGVRLTDIVSPAERVNRLK